MVRIQVKNTIVRHNTNKTCIFNLPEFTVEIQLNTHSLNSKTFLSDFIKTIYLSYER